jgi:tryptophanyl-tRNA synthetase
MPEASIDEDVATVPGLDGAKMSKSYNNTIEIFCDEKTLKKRVNSIVTDSTPVEDPKDAEKCNVFAISKLFYDKDELASLKARYEKGGEGYGVFKSELKDKIWSYFEPYREKREYYLNHKDEVRDILKAGAKRARERAMPIIEKVRTVTGVI